MSTYVTVAVSTLQHAAEILEYVSKVLTHHKVGLAAAEDARNEALVLKQATEQPWYAEWPITEAGREVIHNYYAKLLATVEPAPKPEVRTEKRTVVKPLLLRMQDTVTGTNVHTGKPESYSVEGDYLGAPGFDSLVELRPLTNKRGSAATYRQNAFIPRVMLEAGVNSGVFKIST